MCKKVMVGMSGGVDSAIAAYLLKKQGCYVAGATMKLFSDENNTDINDAEKCCEALGIEHTVIDFNEIFKSKVINHFVKSYLDGKTPNPCIVCNRHIKFGAMLDYALSCGFDFIATGHYCKTEFSSEFNRWFLRKSSSEKDQSYVLYSLTQNMLSHVLMPLGDYKKDDIRKIADGINLPIANKPDSQDICFVKDNNYQKFIASWSNPNLKKGNFIDKNGNILGKHNGIVNYTIGQRKGLGIAFGKPVFVTEINSLDNTVTLGDNKDLFSNKLSAENVNFILFDELKKPMTVYAKIRYKAPLSKAVITPLGKDKVSVDFEIPQRAVTPGQSIVFYDGDLIVGGGIII